MKNISKYSSLNSSDERPIPVPEDNLYNNPDEDNFLTSKHRSVAVKQKSKPQNNEK